MEHAPAKDNPVTPFALTNYRDIRQRFGIKQKNRRGHMYLVGKTGTGKSTLILNMAAHDIESGYGLALIDPHGDLAEGVLESVSERRIKDVIYFNPADLEYPVAFNPLQNVPGVRSGMPAGGRCAAAGSDGCQPLCDWRFSVHRADGGANRRTSHRPGAGPGPGSAAMDGNA